MKRPLTILGLALLGVFAFIGIVFTFIYIGMQFGLFNVRGTSTERNAFFLSAVAPSVAHRVESRSAPCDDTSATVCDWNKNPQWEVVKEGLRKDKDIIARVSLETGVSPRLIASVVIPEQIRFFTAEREVFKSYFEPLKILGSLSQFSLGVSGIKQETAVQIERHALDASSSFFPGSSIAPLLKYPEGVAHDQALFARLTDEKDHYYSYLYTAVAIKELMSQWERASFPLDQKPGIVITLFNIGFGKSHPHAAPELGGAPIQVGGKTYSFGVLGEQFYLSNELRDVFPY
jgi:hypothetical protein